MRLFHYSFCNKNRIWINSMGFTKSKGISTWRQSLIWMKSPKFVPITKGYQLGP